MTSLYDVKATTRGFEEGELGFQPVTIKFSPKLQRNWDGPNKIKNFSDVPYHTGWYTVFLPVESQGK